MKAVIVGTGSMGMAIAYGMHKLNFDVLVTDISDFSLKETSRKLSNLGCDVSIYQHIPTEENPDIVISAVPWKYTFGVAKLCADNNLRYCDLGGNPSVSETIQNYSSSKPVFTDLGLAPGWANIIAEKGYNIVNSDKGKVEQVKIFVGGLPQNPHGSLAYGMIFNVEGLVNEYIGECEILKDGKRVSVPALSGIEECKFYNSPLEAAFTKGGLSKTLDLMNARQVRECSYKTLRFPKHFDYLNFLVHECKLHDMNVKDSSYSALENCLLNACPQTKGDFVIVAVFVDKWEEMHIVYSNDCWTAMQMTTAFPAAAVAAIIASGQHDNKLVMDYSDVPLEQFEKNMDTIGFPCRS